MDAKKKTKTATTATRRTPRLPIRVPEEGLWHREYIAARNAGHPDSPESEARARAAYRRNPELARADERGGGALRADSIYAARSGLAYTQYDTTKKDAERVMRRAIAPKPKPKKK